MSATTVAMLTKHKCLQCDQTPCSLTASVHRTHQEAWGIANDALNSDTSCDKYQTSYAWTSGARVPGSVVEVTLSSKLPFFYTLDRTSTTPSPRDPFGSLLGSFFPINHVSKKTIVFHVVFFCFFSASLHSYCLIACTTAPKSTKLRTKTAAKSRKLRPGIQQDLLLRPGARWRGGRR